MRASEFVTEIENMKQSHFRGGKDTLDRYSTPGKKHLRALPGGSDLMYSITSDAYGSYVHIVDPGIPGITKPSIVASLSLTKGVIPDSVQVGAITVDEDYRGRGLARALYGIVLTIMKKTLISGSSQTPGGRRNWLSLASIPGVEIKGLLDLANFQLEKSRQVDNTIDQLMQLGGQFVARDNNYTYWAFDVVPGNGQLAPAVKNKLSKLYGYDSDNLLMATWTGGQQDVAEGLTEYKNTPLQDYNGLQFMIDSNHPYLRVEAFAPGSGQQLAQVDFKIDDQDELHPEDLHVEERWRGQGIAQIMYDFVKSKGYTIHRSWSQTDAGAGFWDKHRGEERVWEQGVAEGKQPGQPVVDAILKVMPIAQEIWFHGSRATRSHRKNSDTDILVIVPDDLVGDQYLGAVRILQKLSTHFDNHDIQPTKAETNIHRIAQEEGRLLWSNKQAVAENFADGRNPQDKGDSVRHGIPKNATMAELEKASHAAGRKGQLARWQLNMRRGKKK